MFLAVAFVAAGLCGALQPAAGIPPEVLQLTQFGPALAVAAVALLWPGRIRDRLAGTLPARGSGPAGRQGRTTEAGSRAALLLTPVLITALSAGGILLVSGSLPVTSPRALAHPLALLVTAQLLGACAEEIGWRCYLQPLLRTRFGPVTSSVLVGTVWGLWHVPVLAQEPAYAAGFLTATIAMSVILGLALERVRSNRLLLAGGFHTLVNLGMLFVTDETSRRQRRCCSSVPPAWPQHSRGSPAPAGRRPRRIGSPPQQRTERADMTEPQVGMAQADRRPGIRLRGALADIGRCQLLSLAALAVSGAGGLVVGALLLLPVGIGFLLLPPAAAALRHMSDRYRDWAARWTGTVISPPGRFHPGRSHPSTRPAATDRPAPSSATTGSGTTCAGPGRSRGRAHCSPPCRWPSSSTASSARPCSPSSGGSWAPATGTPSSRSTPPRPCSPRSCSASDSSAQGSGWPPPPCGSTHAGAAGCWPPRTPPNSSAASSTSPAPAPTSSTSRPPNCGASSGTCTTAHKPAWSPWA
ncbi:CPBP family glutamic-type intramembrane protease [Streptomyces sp. MS1.HAVA.3]|uniref:CPBP family glutamic-type intramembrane protease n=1 Tax=Streptomyces caledonius TaxID=3134107 RepID=A0ABU8UEV3_9ACTN